MQLELIEKKKSKIIDLVLSRDMRIYLSYLLINLKKKKKTRTFNFNYKSI